MDVEQTDLSSKPGPELTSDPLASSLSSPNPDAEQPNLSPKPESTKTSSVEISGKLSAALPKANLNCLYHRNKYLKRLRLIALTTRNKLIATLDRMAPPQSSKTTASVPIHDPELEQDLRAFTKLEKLAHTCYNKDGAPSIEHFGCSHREMESLSRDYNWVSYLPFSGETPILVPDIGLFPLVGKVLRSPIKLSFGAFMSPVNIASKVPEISADV